MGESTVLMSKSDMKEWVASFEFEFHVANGTGVERVLRTTAFRFHAEKDADLDEIEERAATILYETVGEKVKNLMVLEAVIEPRL